MRTELATLTDAPGGQWFGVGVIAFFLTAATLSAQVSDADFQKLRDQNRRLEEQTKHQQALIDQLTARFNEFQHKVRETPPADAAKSEPPPPASKDNFLKKLHISGEVGLGVFSTGTKGSFPKTPFRVDEARLFLEAPVWESVYLFTELNLTTRETSKETFELGEVYLDAENLSRLWGRDGQLTLRAGRFNIPFGDEYIVRHVMDNPLVSHSLADFWGIDEGVELYGALGKFHYFLAVQNGGHPQINDFNTDKAVTAKISFDPVPWFHASASALRTGGLDVKDDKKSEMWFGNGFFRQVGDTNKTTTFHVELAQLDARARWHNGYLALSGGLGRYEDNNPVANNGRNIYFYSVEGAQDLAGKLYGAARFSAIRAPEGIPVVGNGNYAEYFNGPLTSDLWRLSLGLGYRFSPDLILKAEYTFERGKLLNGTARNQEDFLGVEVGLKF